MAPLFKNVLFAAGGDVLAKYGTPIWRKGLQARGGETAYTFARTGNGLYLANDLTVGGLKVLTAAGGILRFDQQIDPVNAVLQSYLKLEAIATNYCLQSQAWATAPWGNNVVTATNNFTTAPDGTNTATKLLPNNTGANNNPYATQGSITITSGEFIAVSCFVKANGYSGVVVRGSDSTSTNGFQVSFDLVNGALGTVTGPIGAGVLTGKTFVALGNGWYWIGLWGQINAGVVSAQLFCYVYDTIAHANAQTAYTADGVSSVLGWGFQLERNGTSTSAPPTAYIATTTGTATRNADTWSVPAPFAPQPLWVYLRFLERGSAATSATGVFSLASAVEDGSLDSLVIRSIFNGGVYQIIHGTNVASVTVQAASAPTYGQVCELLGLLNADGSVTLRQSINGAADAVVGPSGAQAFGTPWTTLRLNGNNAFWANIGRNAFSRVLVGTGVGTVVNTIADVRNAL